MIHTYIFDIIYTRCGVKRTFLSFHFYLLSYHFLALAHLADSLVLLKQVECLSICHLGFSFKRKQPQL